MKFNKIIHGDCLEIMSQFQDKSFSIIVTSPPYNLRNSCTSTGSNTVKRKVNKLKDDGYSDYDDNMPYDKYVKWQKKCLKEMLRLIPDTGAIFYNHKWRVQNKLIQDRREILTGFPVRQIIIWARTGAINFNDAYFLPTYEVIYLIAKPKFKLLPKMCKYGDVWHIHQEIDKNNSHPAPFPVAIPYRIISSCDNVDSVLDPFCGSGTTAIAALQNGKQYIGIEQSSQYVRLAENRIKEYIRSKGRYNLFGK